MHTFIFIKTQNYTIPLLYLRGRTQPPNQVIIFSHGSSENLQTIEQWLRALTDICNADVVGYEYPGYGLSKCNNYAPTEPSEKAVYEAIDGVYDHLTTQLAISPFKIILFGRSLGTGPTIDLAARQPGIKGVVLQSPFLSAVRVVMCCTVTPPFDVFASIDKIHKVLVPVFICHGTADKVVNVSHGKKLSEKLPNKTFPPLFLEGAGHNDIEKKFLTEYTLKLQEFITYITK